MARVRCSSVSSDSRSSSCSSRLRRLRSSLHPPGEPPQRRRRLERPRPLRRRVRAKSLGCRQPSSLRFHRNHRRRCRLPPRPRVVRPLRRRDEAKLRRSRRYPAPAQGKLRGLNRHLNHRVLPRCRARSLWLHRDLCRRRRQLSRRPRGGHRRQRPRVRSPNRRRLQPLRRPGRRPRRRPRITSASRCTTSGLAISTTRSPTTVHSSISTMPARKYTTTSGCCTRIAAGSTMR